MKSRTLLLALALCHVSAAQQFEIAQSIDVGTGKQYTLQAVDFDGDGRLDLLAPGLFDDQVFWYRGQGDGTFDPRAAVTGTVDGPLAAFASDLDGDGDPDVLSIGRDDNRVIWTENLGGGSFGMDRVISSTTTFGTGISAADIDGDGRPDALVAAAVNDEVLWFQNLGGGSFGPPQVVTGAIGNPVIVRAADLDGDGDQDVICSGYGGIGLGWCENLGGGTLGPAQTFATGLTAVLGLHIDDLDGDGLVDVLVTTEGGTDRVAWFRNLGGGTFGPEQVIGVNVIWPRGIDAADFDLDGDLDVVAVSARDDRVIWYANQGNGTFSTEQVLSTTDELPYACCTGDFDGDGDMDVIASFVLDDELSYSENLQPRDCNNNGIEDDVEIQAGTAIDCNGDGAIDACQIASDLSLDLDANGVLDTCEIQGASYCGPAVPNSTGASATIMALGSTAIAANDLTLSAFGLPQGSFAVFLTSTTQGFTFPVSNSQGALCLGGQVGRFVGAGEITAAGALGAVTLDLDLTAIPTPLGFVAVAGGETWNFQAWFRDGNPGPTSNFTDGVAVTF